MGKPTGFLENGRAKQPYRPVEERIHDWRQVMQPWPVEPLKEQAARCMDCGIPFCHQGCPLGNLIPDWNDLVYRDQWHEAINRLHAPTISLSLPAHSVRHRAKALACSVSMMTR
jgi:glutamate synthase (NADPH/NADH) small chain